MGKMFDKTKNLGVRVTPYLHKELKKKCASESITMQDLCNRLLTKALQYEKYKISQPLGTDPIEETL